MSKNQRYNDRDSYDDSRGDDSYSDYTSQYTEQRNFKGGQVRSESDAPYANARKGGGAQHRSGRTPYNDDSYSQDDYSESQGQSSFRTNQKRAG